MTEITVLERRNGKLSNEIRRMLNAPASPFSINCTPSPRELFDLRAELLVVAPDFAPPDGCTPPRIKCRILLIPGASDASLFDSWCFVTYGMSPKSTITVSSISGDRLVISLQREVVTLTGAVLERQEVVTTGGASVEYRLAAAGVALLSGLFLP